MIWLIVYFVALVLLLPLACLFLAINKKPNPRRGRDADHC
jgi:hypothetical protein